jgi:N-carbamoylputrescine amidase
MNKDITLDLIQMSCPTDLEKNIEKTIDNIKKVANLGAQIVCTQELFKSPYFCHALLAADQL